MFLQLLYLKTFVFRNKGDYTCLQQIMHNFYFLLKLNQIIENTKIILLYMYINSFQVAKNLKICKTIIIFCTNKKEKTYNSKL